MAGGRGEQRAGRRRPPASLRDCRVARWLAEIRHAEMIFAVIHEFAPSASSFTPSFFFFLQEE